MIAETLSSIHWVGAHQLSMLNTKMVIDMAGRDLPQKYTPVAFALVCALGASYHH